MLNVTVERSKWYRGKGDEKSRLRRRWDGQMCCLGFACLAAGHTEEEITDKPFPVNVKEPREALAPLIAYNTNSIACAVIGHTNDSKELTEADRESRLTEWGLRAGIAFTFVD